MNTSFENVKKTEPLKIETSKIIAQKLLATFAMRNMRVEKSTVA